MSENPYAPKSSAETASAKYDAIHGSYQPKEPVSDATPRPSFKQPLANLKSGK